MDICLISNTILELMDIDFKGKKYSDYITKTEFNDFLVI